MQNSATGMRWATRFSEVREPRALLSAAGVRNAARGAFLSLAGVALRVHEPSFLRCLYLHYVYDDQVEDFRRLLRSLLAIGEFVTAEDVVGIVAGEKPLVGRKFHLSMDDGFDNVFRNAAPVLEDLGIRATFFVPSAWVGASEVRAFEMWWMHESVRMPTRPLTWEQVRALGDAGHEIGSHSRTHARLAEVARDPVRLAQEVSDSKREIEDALGRPCRFFSWPFGTREDFGEAACAAVEEAGYQGCFSAVRGRVRGRSTSRWEIPRHHFEPDWPWSHVRYFALGGRE